MAPTYLPFKPLLNFILPHRCVMCREVIQAASAMGLCGPCWGTLTFTTDASCFRCGYPFEITPDTPQECAYCLSHPPAFSKYNAPLIYDDASKDLILKFKHGDHTNLAPTFARWILNTHQRSRDPFLHQTDFLVPVPLHWTRLWKRRYNQAGLLANELSKLTGIPTDHTTLIRTRATQSQGHLTHTERKKNVEGCFRIKKENLSSFKEKVITLIDDVFTSGATVRTCAEELKKASVKDVYVLTLARVAKL